MLKPQLYHMIMSNVNKSITIKHEHQQLQNNNKNQLFHQFSRPLVSVSTADIPVLHSAEVVQFYKNNSFQQNHQQSSRLFKYCTLFLYEFFFYLKVSHLRFLMRQCVQHKYGVYVLFFFPIGFLDKSYMSWYSSKEECQETNTLGKVWSSLSKFQEEYGLIPNYNSRTVYGVFTRLYIWRSAPL